MPLLLTIPPAGQLPSPLPSLLPTCFFYVNMLLLPCGHAMSAIVLCTLHHRYVTKSGFASEAVAAGGTWLL